jgi:hypothetical protein
MNFQNQYQFARRDENDRINAWQRFIIKEKEGWTGKKCADRLQPLLSICRAF